MAELTPRIMLHITSQVMVESTAKLRVLQYIGSRMSTRMVHANEIIGNSIPILVTAKVVDSFSRLHALIYGESTWAKGA